MSIADERWCSIPGYLAYEASSQGRIRSIERTIIRKDGKPLHIKGRVLAQCTTAKGYKNAGPAGPVHVLVCLAFHGPRPDGLLACHGPLGKTINTPDNLYWGPPSQNLGDDKRRDGTTLFGTRNPAAKLTPDQVTEIRQLAGSMSQTQLAKRYGVAQTTVSLIIRNELWTQAP